MLHLMDVVWPALYISERTFAGWMIFFGLIIELYFVKRFFDFSLIKAIVVTLSMNAATTLIGITQFPVLGALVDVTIANTSGLRIFHPIIWITSFFILLVINTIVESIVLLLFKRKRKIIHDILIVGLANLVTLAFVLVTMIIYHPEV
jgi:hypothetical protein